MQDFRGLGFVVELVLKLSVSAHLCGMIFQLPFENTRWLEKIDIYSNCKVRKEAAAEREGCPNGEAGASLESGGTGNCPKRKTKSQKRLWLGRGGTVPAASKHQPGLDPHPS